MLLQRRRNRLDRHLRWRNRLVLDGWRLVLDGWRSGRFDRKWRISPGRPLWPLGWSRELLFGATTARTSGDAAADDDQQQWDEKAGAEERPQWAQVDPGEVDHEVEEEGEIPDRRQDPAQWVDTLLVGHIAIQTGQGLVMATRSRQVANASNTPA